MPQFKGCCWSVVALDIKVDSPLKNRKDLNVKAFEDVGQWWL